MTGLPDCATTVEIGPELGYRTCQLKRSQHVEWWKGQDASDDFCLAIYRIRMYSSNTGCEHPTDKPPPVFVTDLLRYIALACDTAVYADAG